MKSQNMDIDIELMPAGALGAMSWYDSIEERKEAVRLLKEEGCRDFRFFVLKNMPGTLYCLTVIDD